MTPFLLLAPLLLLASTVLGAACSSSPAAEGSIALQATLAPQAEQGSELSLPPRPAWDNDIRFEHISVSEGLSQSAVQSVVQDRQGFLWFGTQDGLNRYDGHDFLVYGHDPADPGSLGDDYVWVVYEDSGGTLWVGTNGGGLDRFDPDTQSFVHYQNVADDPNSLSHNTVLAMSEDRAGNLWIGTLGGGLNRFMPDTGQFVRYLNDPEDSNSLSGNVVNSLFPDGDGGLWVGTTAGLNKFDPVQEHFIRYQNDLGDPTSLGSNIVQAVFQDSEGVLWVGTNGGGLHRFDPTSDGFVHYQNDPENPHSLSENNVTAIFQDRHGRLWVGTNAQGLNRLVPETGQFVHYQQVTGDPHSLSNNGILTFFQDREGMLWIGTFGGGLSKINPLTERFVHYKHNPDDPQSLSNPFVWSVLEDSQGTLWVGTGGGGLNRLDPGAPGFAHYRNDPDDPNSLADDTVFSLFEDDQGTIWVGTDNGNLDRFDRQSETFEHLQTFTVLTMIQDREGVLWLGTAGGGLGRLDPTTGQLSYLQNDPNNPQSLSNNTIFSLYEDRQGKLWMGTFGGGLNRYDPTTGRFERFQNDPDDTSSLVHDTVLALHEDQNGALWVGTHGGLDRLDRATGMFTHYGEADGLANDAIYGILEDDQGHLWLSTNIGLSRFDPQTETFTSFFEEDGLQDNEFNSGSYFGSPRGVIHFGGINGLTAFYPEDIVSNPYVPPLVLTSLTQGGEPVPLDAAIQHAPAVTLQWPGNYFEFEYAALSYAKPEGNRYAYMLEGFDENWNQTEGRRFGRYTNIPGGTYTLRIKGSNNDGIWNETGTSLAVTVVPPFWQTWWFRGLLGILVIGMIVGAFGLRLRVIENRRRQLELEVRERTRELRETMVALEHSKEAAEAANRAKSVFLANMTHELRTPLNAILGFTQLMQRDINLTADQEESLEIINRSGEHLLGLINEVLELSKIEAGRVLVKEESFDLYWVLDSLEEVFRMRAEGQGLTLLTKHASDLPQYVQMDEGKLCQVLMNLLGNAVKFTEDGGVMLRADAKPLPDGDRMQLIFEVSDSGPGIALEDMDVVFAPFEQTTAGQQALEGTGLGLPLSRQYVGLMGGELTVSSPAPRFVSGGGPGSQFRVVLPAEVVDATAVHEEKPRRRVVGLEPNQPQYRLLVVEDNWANRKLLVRLLSPLGFEVQEATNGLEALESWEAWHPHVILLDMRMPIMDGYEATRRIRASAESQDTVIIALTASALEEDRAVILAEGCDAFVRKPFREEDLFDALAEHLGVRFIYQDLSSREAQPMAVDQSPMAAALANLPGNLVSDLEEATIQADLEQILLVVDQIHVYDSGLAAELSILAHNFDHDAILQLIRSVAASTDAAGD